MRTRLLAALLLSLPLLPGAAEPLEFLDHGRPVATLELDALTARVRPVTVELDRKSLGRKERYRALPFRALLDEVYGPAWRRAEMLLMTCRDGYQPILAVQPVLDHEADTRGYLAYEVVGGDGLWEEDAEGEEEDMGPYRLFWKGVGGRPATSVLELPYMITRIDLIEFDDRFPRLAPADGSPRAVVAGFNAFRQNCLKCHTLNGEGSDAPLGPDLNYPASVTEYWKRAWLVRFIVDPAAVRHGTRMPGLARLPKTQGMTRPEKDRVAEDIVRYLEAMARKKLAPR